MVHAVDVCGVALRRVCASWTMRAYSMLASNPKPEAWEVDNAFDGNLCRCTGMFPILTAFKTFAPSTDADASSPSAGAGAGAGAGGGAGGAVAAAGSGCCGGGAAAAGTSGCCGGGAVSPSAILPPPMPLPEALRSYAPTPKRFGTASVQWFAPVTLADLTALQAQFATAPAGTVKYVCGNTTYGVEKYFNGLGAPTPYTVSMPLEGGKCPAPSSHGVAILWWY